MSCCCLLFSFFSLFFLCLKHVASGLQSFYNVSWWYFLDLSYFGVWQLYQICKFKCLLAKFASFQLWFFEYIFSPTVFIFLPGLRWQNCQLFIKVLQPWVFLHILCCPEWVFSTVLNQADQFLPLYSSVGFQAIEIFVLFFYCCYCCSFLHRLLYFSVKKIHFVFL